MQENHNNDVGSKEARDELEEDEKLKGNVGEEPDQNEPAGQKSEDGTPQQQQQHMNKIDQQRRLLTGESIGEKRDFLDLDDVKKSSSSSIDQQQGHGVNISSSPTPLIGDTDNDSAEDIEDAEDEEHLRNDQTVDGGVFIINKHFDDTTIKRFEHEKFVNADSRTTSPTRHKNNPDNALELDNFVYGDFKSHHPDADKKRHSSSSTSSKPESVLPWYQVDFYCLPDKVAYMLQEMRYASNLPYLFTLFTSFGVTQSQAGIILGVRLVGTVIGNSVWGIIADKSKRHRLIVFVQVVMALLLFLSQLFISMTFGDPGSNQCPGKPSNVSATSSKNNSNSVGDTTRNLYTEEDRTVLFWIILFVNVAICFFEGSIASFLDVAVIRKIEMAPYKIDFGAQRKFGTIGYAIGVTVTKAIIDLEPQMSISCSSLIFAVYPVFIIMELICIEYNLSIVSFTDAASSIVGDTTLPTLKRRMSSGFSYSRKLFNVLKKGDSIVFFLTALYIGMEISSKAFFVIAYIQGKDSIALFFTLFFWVGSISVFFGFGFSFLIIDKLGGTWNAMILVSLTNAVKFFGYVYLPGVWPLLACEVLDFICQGLAVTTIIKHVGLISSVDILTFMFSLTNSLTFGLGFLVTSVSGGYIYEFYGGEKFYLIQAVFSLSWTFALVVYRLGRQLRNSRTRDISL